MVAEARRRGDQGAEEAVVAEWQGRLRGLLGFDPAAVEQLRTLLGTLGPPATTPTTRISLRADARGHGRNYQSAGDMEIHE